MAEANENEGPLSSFYETRSGHPFHEWIVTTDGGAAGWWGEGYVARTVNPCVTLKWGFTSKSEHKAMSAGVSAGEDKFLSVLLLNSVSANETNPDELQGLVMEGLSAVIHKLRLLAGNHESD